MKRFQISRPLWLIAACVCAAPLHAERGQPASLLLFPMFDTREGIVTVVTVTNSSRTESIHARWTYTASEDCTPWGRTESLTPNDTLTVLTQYHYPFVARGFLTIHAVSAVSAEALTFNYLTGIATVIDGVNELQYTVEPFAYRALTGHLHPTDVDGDHQRDLDGREYQAVPDVLLFPRFLGQEPFFLPHFQSELVLINLTASGTALAQVEFEVFNDNENVFTLEHAFECWTVAPLLDLSFLFSNSFLQTTNEDPDEVVGAPAWESGWFRVDGLVATTPERTLLDPAILGMLIDRIPANSASAPFGEGRQGNGSLGP